MIFLIAMQAELTQTPFDMPVAESELVTGYMTEYSRPALPALLHRRVRLGRRPRRGRRHAVPRWWAIPFVDLDSNAMNVVGPVVMLTKIMLIGGLVFFVRFTYPRFREDQLQQLAWKVLIPISLVNITATGILKVVF